MNVAVRSSLVTRPAPSRFVDEVDDRGRGPTGDRPEQVDRDRRAAHGHHVEQCPALGRHRLEPPAHHVAYDRRDGVRILTRGHGPAELAREEGMAAAPAVDDLSPLLRRVVSGDRAHQRGHLRLIQCRQGDQLGRHRQLSEDGGDPGPRLARTVGADEHQPSPQRAAHQEAQQVERRQVAPLQVVEDDHHGAFLRRS